MLENYIELPLHSLVEAEWNYKVDNPDLIETLANNLKRNGQLENIIVREFDNNNYEDNGYKNLDQVPQDKMLCGVCYEENLKRRENELQNN